MKLWDLSSVYVTMANDVILDQPKRRRLLDYIKRFPGTTFREVVRATGFASGTTRHHLNVLKRHGLVAEYPHKKTLRLFQPSADLESTWQTVVLMRDPHLHRLLMWLDDNPGRPQKGIIEAASDWGWSRSTTQHRLGRLVDEGLVECREFGQSKRYEPRIPDEARHLIDEGIPLSR